MTNGSQPEPPLDAPFADWLRWALIRHGYDPEERGVQRRFADASGLPVATVSRLLRNASQPDVSTCYALGVTFGVPVLPLLVRAGHLPAQVLDKEPSPTERPAPATQQQALAALGITDPADQAAVLSMINALKAKDRREGAN
ncbi:helix-turn-helix domain-containing protein [Streptomyces shenzhenensis]|uniref:helix-turn-helix domain-containing protein n=1 Tax=Streptomyces shenzhenensis TaxID=943815 RepID=UPI000EF957F7|nr:helix-turn-helix transcriptional regulator [Streptomyces shenzhenensis]